MTVTDAFHRCWAGYWNCPRFQLSGWAREVQGYWRRRIEKHAIAAMPLTEVTPRVVRAWHFEIGSTVSQIEANRAMEVLSRIFTYAEAEELVPLGFNPCRVVKSYPEKKRERFASPDEIRRLGKVLFSHWDDHPRDTGFILCLLLTGARPSTLERMAWSNVRESIAKVRGKSTGATGQPDTIVLPEYVMRKILQRVPRREDGLIFGPGLPQRHWERVRTEAGCPDLWARDLRRTFATAGLSEGVTAGIIGELLNHKSTQTTARYAKLFPSVRIAAVNKIADGLIEWMRGGER